MFRHVLVPTDGSTLSRKLVKRAIPLAKSLSAKITALHVVPASFGIAIDAKTQARLLRLATKDGHRVLEQIGEAASAAGVEFDPVLLENNDPWKGIITTARKRRCDLIMMAAHGRRGMSAIVLGSETNKVLVNSKIAVLVYR